MCIAYLSEGDRSMSWGPLNRFSSREQQPAPLPSGQAVPWRPQSLLKVVLIAGLIEACFPLLAIPVNWRLHAQRFPGIFVAPFGDFTDQAALLVSILLHASDPTTSFYVTAAFLLYSPYYLTPVLCGVVAFFTPVTAPIRMGCRRGGIITSLWAVLLCLGPTLPSRAT